MTVVKICGIMEPEHGVAALEAGADLLGFVFAPSRRQLSPEQATAVLLECRQRFPSERRLWHAVGVFANQPAEFVSRAAVQCGLDVVQLSGVESPEYCRQIQLPLYKAIHVPELVEQGDDLLHMQRRLRQLKDFYRGSRLLLDSGGSGRWGGTGESFRWNWVGEIARECVVAGGLGPGNVAQVLAELRPWGVDVSSGVETDGRKDPELIRLFISEVKRGDGDGRVE